MNSAVRSIHFEPVHRPYGIMTRGVCRQCIRSDNNEVYIQANTYALTSKDPTVHLYIVNMYTVCMESQCQAGSVQLSIFRCFVRSLIYAKIH